MSYDPKILSLGLGLGAAVLWFLSAAYSFYGLRITLDLTAPKGYDRDFTGILIGTDDNGGGAFSINGMAAPTRTAVLKYQKDVFRAGAIVSGLNGAAAFLACVASLLAFVI